MTKRYRAKRSGSLFYRRDKGLWVFAVDLGPDGEGKRQRRTYYGKTAGEAERKAQAAHPFLAEPRLDRPRYRRRQDYLNEARAKGRHTRQEWWRKVAEADWRCHYCGVDTRDLPGGVVRDHVVPLTRGGSDALENVVPCCRPCNYAKGDRTAEEWAAEKRAINA